MFNVFSQTGMPGFRVRPEDDVPGFDIDENGLPRRERSDGMRPGSPTPQYPDLAQAMMATPQYPDLARAMMPAPGPEDSVQPVLPQPPDWLHTLLTMPLSALPGSSPFASPGWARSAPFGMLFNPVRSFPTTDQNVREMGDATGGAVTEQWPSFDALTPLMDTDVRHSGATAQNANPQPAGEEAMRDAWPQPPDDGQPHAQTAVAGPQDLSSAEMARQPIGAMPPLSVGSAADPNIALANAGGDGVQEAQQQKPLPQNQQTPQKKPPVPLGTGQGRTPPAPRNPEKPGMEMTELERSHEQEFARFNEKYRQLKEAERRQPLWDKIIRSPAPVITPENKLQDLLPDDWQEKFDPRYVAWTRAAAERNNIPLELLARLLYKESNYNKNRVSPSGARGIAQLMPGAIKEVGLDPLKFNYFDPQASIDAGAAYLAQHYRRFGNWPKAAAAYNAGPNYVRGWLEGVSPDWSAMPKEDKRARRWREMNTYLQYIFRGQPEYFDK